jgi:hypothetical protein
MFRSKIRLPQARITPTIMLVARIADEGAEAACQAA